MGSEVWAEMTALFIPLALGIGNIETSHSVEIESEERVGLIACLRNGLWMFG